MKRKLLATLALTLGVSVLSSCASVITFPAPATDPNVPLWEEPQTEAPSEPSALLGIWYSDRLSNVFRFGEGGVLTVWSLTPGYEYEYSYTATGSYTYDGTTLSMTLGNEQVTKTCKVLDGIATLDGSVTMALRTDAPAEHPSYPYPDFEALAASLPLLPADALTGLTVSAAGKRLQATVQMKQTYWKGKDLEKRAGGTAVLGDTVNIDFTGKVDGVAFEGGAATGVDVTVAPDTGYIAGFCEGIAGHAAGETFDVSVTFPENYGNDALAGKEAVFTMTLNAIYETGITDEMVAAYEGNDYATVTEWETAVWNELMTSAVWSLIPALADFRDETDAYRYYYQDMLDVYHYYAASYGMQFERFLSFYGMTVSALEARSRETARSYLLAATVVRALDLTPEADWLSRFETAYIADYVASGYTEAQVRERIASGEGRLAYRAAMLSELAAERLVASNTFTD